MVGQGVAHGDVEDDVAEVGGQGDDVEEDVAQRQELMLLGHNGLPLSIWTLTSDRPCLEDIRKFLQFMHESLYVHLKTFRQIDLETIQNLLEVIKTSMK